MNLNQACILIWIKLKIDLDHLEWIGTSSGDRDRLKYLNKKFQPPV